MHVYREEDIAIYASEYAYMYIYSLYVCCRTMNSTYYVLSTHKYHFLLTETVELLSVNGYGVQKWFYHCEPTIFSLAALSNLCMSSSARIALTLSHVTICRSFSILFWRCIFKSLPLRDMHHLPCSEPNLNLWVVNAHSCCCVGII